MNECMQSFFAYELQLRLLVYSTARIVNMDKYMSVLITGSPNTLTYFTQGLIVDYLFI